MKRMKIEIKMVRIPLESPLSWLFEMILFDIFKNKNLLMYDKKNKYNNIIGK